VTHVVAVGSGPAGDRLAAGAAGTSAVRVPDAAAALDLLRDRVSPGDVVLVKASRAIGLEVVGERLLDATGLEPAVAAAGEARA
jgi:UDP-N-acetylmuramoyl-tripeptide--D-alanyl-D-alanine ligase